MKRTKTISVANRKEAETNVSQETIKKYIENQG